MSGLRGAMARNTPDNASKIEKLNIKYLKIVLNFFMMMCATLGVADKSDEN